MNKVEIAYKIKAELGEGPSWDREQNVLYWTDIASSVVYIFDPNEGVNATIPIGQNVGAVVVDENSNLIVAAENGFYQYDMREKKLELIEDPEESIPENRFNDGKCDAKGRFWAGTMDREGRDPTGSLYCLDSSLTVEKKLSNLTTSNGIAWNMANDTMYFIDTPTRNVYVFDYDLETGRIENQRVAIKIPEELGSPDGMTIDTDDKLWIAGWGNGKLSRWDPVKGELLSTIDIPAKQVTSCTFGGENLDTLYITTARIGLSEQDLEQWPLSGSLFRLKTDVKGLAAHRFKQK
ncbi:sugar lactone lactonase YvrE [Gracilibacillus halotolerans]|uniref:Sugar lactone lactonase YvrE n=1 Tax=Gracilibacillus halotolerans TaxID=74386 RepID=A0A841RID7_9BACI|nr:SMP-30/gluconolactonase/LRE family protein [Gracilibacillus halotolerans]MBB6512431.1 sugar lactone lactonase YvrE [Gracilibacillus halotolerans]